MTAQILIVALAVFLAAWLYADSRLFDQGKRTVTQLVISASKQYPFVAWLIGFLMGLLTGHLYG